MTRCLVVALLLSAALPAVAAPAPVPDEDPAREVREALVHRGEEAAGKIRLMRKRLETAPAASAAQDAYDVHHYDLELQLDPTIRLLTGTGTTAATVLAGPLTSLELDLDANMTVSACRAAGAPAAFTHAADKLTVTLDRAYAAGETVTVSVDYAGDPAGSYFGWDSHGGLPMIWTLSEPFGAREWWPCKDLNTDKADSVDVRVSVPQELIVAGNGLLVSDTSDGVWRTFHWRTRYPIATYLVSLAIHPYQTFSTWYAPLGGGDPMEIQHYVFADQYANAQNAYASTDEMMTVFAQAFGEYPFVAEKYGHASFVWGGGMEHQTMTSMGGLWEDVISHELGHQWWGDMVTCADFGHIWLNEGFATWSEAYWKEQTEGVAVYKAYMDGAAYYGPGTIFVEDTSDFWGIFDTNLSYNKASWVVHMLRGALGDADFFAGLAAYRAQYGFGSATTEQFRDVMEAVSGRDLDAFFQQWIYGDFFPIYAAGWSQTGGTLALTIDQVQTEGGLFAMPVTVRITTDQGVEDVVVENAAAASQDFQIPVSGAVQSVVLDPDDWILCQVQSVVAAPTLDRGVLVVNGVDWSVYGDEITSCYDDSVFGGAQPFDFWDAFAAPAGGYPSALPEPRGHGSVPGDVLGQYSAVVWVGNNYNGDLAKWQETPVVSYLEAGGNVLLMARYLSDFVDADLQARAGLAFTTIDATLSGGLTAADPALPDLTPIGTQNLLDGFDPATGPQTTLLYTGVLGGASRGMGALHVPAAGGTFRSDGGRLAVISGRPYRWNHAALRAAVETILSDRFLEPYTPTTSIEASAPPARIRLGANYPNPFNPSTTLPLSLPRDGRVELAVYDAAGRRVRTLLSGLLPAGEREAVWDGRDDAGRALASGTYFAGLRSAGGLQVRPLTLVR